MSGSSRGRTAGREWDRWAHLAPSSPALIGQDALTATQIRRGDNEDGHEACVDGSAPCVCGLGSTAGLITHRSSVFYRAGKIRVVRFVDAGKCQTLCAKEAGTVDRNCTSMTETTEDFNAEYNGSYVAASLQGLHLSIAMYRETSILHRSITKTTEAIIQPF